MARRLVELFLGPVLQLVVLGSVGVDAKDLGVDEGRPVSASRARHCVAASRVAGGHVRAVNRDAGDAVAGRSVGDVGIRHLQPDRNRDRVAVVLADEHDGQPVHRREVHAFVELALARPAVAHRAQRHAALALELGGIGDACRLRHPARHHLRHRSDLQLAVAVAAPRDVASGGQGIAGLGEDRKHPLLHGQATHDGVGETAVVRDEPVIGAERRGRGHLDPFVAAARADKRRPPLLDQDVHAIVERLGHAHPAVQVQVLLTCGGGIPGGGCHHALSAFAMSTTSSAVRPIWLR